MQELYGDVTRICVIFCRDCIGVIVPLKQIEYGVSV